MGWPIEVTPLALASSQSIPIRPTHVLHSQLCLQAPPSASAKGSALLLSRKPIDSARVQ